MCLNRCRKTNEIKDNSNTALIRDASFLLFHFFYSFYDIFLVLFFL